MTAPLASPEVAARPIPLAETRAPLLHVEGLTKVFGARRKRLLRAKVSGFAAVEAVSFSVSAGETLGIVGESGSGKSTLARMITRLIDPTAGRIVLGAEDLASLDHETLRQRRRAVQMVFQDPYSSLNPRIRVGDQVGEPMKVHGIVPDADVGREVARLMARVGLDPSRARAFPHAFSGGQRQRIAIARALATEPRLVIADEAVSALDVSVRAQILNLFADLKTSTGLSMVFISHDLGVVRHVADRIGVMFRGRLVELGPADGLFATPRHPYTRDLLAAIPVPHPGARPRRRQAPPTELPAGPANGCPYAERCSLAIDLCRRERPELDAVIPGHLSACHRSGDVAPSEVRGAGRSDAAAARLARLEAHFARHAQEPGEGAP